MRPQSSTSATMSTEPINTQAGPSLLEQRGARVKEFSQAAHSVGQWHRHSEAWEHCYALDGALEIEFNNASVQVLMPGQRCAIAPQQVHRVVNKDAVAVRYLVIQGPGVYDYLLATDNT